MKYNCCILLLLVVVLSACKKSEKTESITYKVAFKTIHITDKTRKYKPGVDSTHQLYYRPIDIDIWYPVAGSPTDSTLGFGDYLKLFEDRIDLYTDSQIGKGYSGKFAQMLSEGFQCSDSTKLLYLPTETLKHKGKIEDNVPVVLYMASYNGMGQENYIMFEDLAKKGFTVVSINSIGRFPGDMTMKKEDAMEQVNDALASVKYLSENTNLKFDKVGILGYSWGGLTGVLAANKIPNVKCVISLDGSEFHHYGFSKEEDTDFEGIYNSAAFQQISLKTPYLRLESSPVSQKSTKDSVNNFLQKVSKDHLILKVDSSDHGDFSAYPFIVKSSGNCKPATTYKTITKLTSAYLEEHLLGSASFNKVLQTELNKTVRRK